MGLKKYLNKAALRTGPSETEQIPRLLIFQGEKESESRLVVSDSLRPHGLTNVDYTVHGILQARILKW